MPQRNTSPESPMLCSGSTMGTQRGILNYIKAMIAEFDRWNERKECRSTMASDDQAIHNYVYYKGKFSNAVSVPHRTGPIHIVGVQADRIFRAAIRRPRARDESGGSGNLLSTNGAIYGIGTTTMLLLRPSVRHGTRRPKDWRHWLPSEHNLIDPRTGFITNFDGRPSPQVHQFDRFGLMVQMLFVLDLHFKK
mmetsp:Transcript_4590/g.7126  ORF Transcript_4590/g.7126 Transcript_4590/m.7126 type:complete len:193 (+) Transcript_4590:657-1235(+)|eukprot:CAMPEP_0178897750 /NCGR_PEP_ID=MMETSP0786-20121207/1930_1 /TAXON_ID=186022 /ORGANISM="Thalassionema frauenfeldii, Strain CCMP 1798" /LENGTH=192 /DNA_ID=CAMNT_0020568355 /DNA_START=1444 /DNA_END=2022 /DNA_ORIENTATION=-